MKYLCLVYAAESALQTQSDSPRDGECAANDEALKASGHFLLGQALQPVSAATTVRMRGLQAKPELNGQRGVVTDFDASSGRCSVQLEDGRGPYKIKPENLEEVVTTKKKEKKKK